MLHSHHAPDMSRVISTYIAQPTSDPAITQDVRDIVISESAILAAMGYGLAIVNRGGVISASVIADAIKDAKGVALNPHSDNHICIGGESPMLALIDLPQLRILRQATLRGATGVTNALWASPDGASSLAIFSTSTGRISFCDPSTMREVNAVAAFGGAITDISSSGFFLAATGLGTRGGISYLEQSVKIFDIRRLETPLPSVMFHTPPMFVMFDAYSSARYNTNGAMWILSPNGFMQCMDISAIASGTPVYPLSDLIQLDAESDAFTGIAVSSEGLVAMGDAGGFVHQWTSSTDVRVNENSEAVWLGPVTTEPPPPSIRLDTLLTTDTGTTIPKCALPEYGNGYLTDEIFGASKHSDTPARHATSRKQITGDLMSLCVRNPFARFPLKISDDILRSAKQHSFVAYAQAPSSFIRNSEHGHKKSPYVRGVDGKGGNKASDRQVPDGGESSTEKSAIKDLDLSRPYARSFYVEMDLVAWESIEGFDFLKYNKSALFCGLENALPNVYVNAAVQVLYFTPPLRRAIGNHVCDRQWCISCELGFLFHMFDLGGAGMACEAGNFTRAFMTMANAGALGLLDGPHALPLSQRIENFSRYLLEQLQKDDESGKESMVWSLFGADTVAHGRFTPSKTKWERQSRSFQHSLVYDNLEQGSSFCELVQRSLSHSLEPTRAFCEATGQFEMMTQKRELRTVPNLLVLGCNTKAPEYERWWYPEEPDSKTAIDSENGQASDLEEVEQAAISAMSESKKLVESLRLDLSDGVRVTELESTEDENENDDVTSESLFGYDRSESQDRIEDTGDMVGDYDLSFVIAHVPALRGEDEEEESFHNVRRNVGGHLVAYIRVPREYRDKEKAAKRSGGGAVNVDAKWWCFNDFVISACEGFAEVAGFHRKWKKACLIGFVRRDILKRVDCRRVEKKVNVREVIGWEDENAAVGLQDDEEAPTKGSLLGLDCEFVMVGRDEAEIFEDGSRRVVVPSRHALARVSVVRGYGALKGKAIIDDYVAVREAVVDYLTRFSGLKEGDLDESRSRYKVRSLKSVYKRLRCLVDVGCTFVGHGLKSDFRIINFVVPPEQVIDTVTLFRVANKRLLGLRFLSNTLLGGDIQSVTHDSIEDANAAIGLYEIYLKLKGEHGSKDVFDITLKRLYTYGYEKGWKVDDQQQFVIDWHT